MKLRNKDDGRVREFGIDETKSFPYYLRDELGNTYWAKTLKEIADKWEDYEEPKEYWYIDIDGEINSGDMEDDTVKDMEKIGNYFETKEEAELAVRKLKAWKRLKDKGFRFDGYDVAHKSNGNLAGQIFYDAGNYCIGDVEKYLDLLFGGEE